MRPDLNKLLCERERALSYESFHNNRRMDEFDVRHDYDQDELDHIHDDEPFTGVSGGHRESMKTRHVVEGNNKAFNENLRPLYGFIHKAVGRKWDDVYSEICKSFDKRGVINAHILQHLFQYVEIKDVFEDEGKLWVRRYGRWAPDLLKNSGVEYYVDPRDGILKRNVHMKTYKEAQRLRDAIAKREQDKVLRVIDKDTELHLLEGVWFEVKFEHFKAKTSISYEKSSYGNRTYQRTVYEYPYKYDVLKRKHVESNKVAVAKRTMSHKDLKKNGLV